MNTGEFEGTIPNISRVGRFMKVSFPRFLNDIKGTFGDKFSDEEIQTFYDNIQLPTRATKGSAGYDFRSPISFTLYGWDDLKIPTGIRAEIDDGWFLSLIPRSGLGFKYYMRFANIFPCIDSDYFFAENEGHIHAKVRVEDVCRELTINAGDAFMQGIFLPYGVTDDDCVDGVRTGGFGSTGR